MSSPFFFFFLNRLTVLFTLQGRIELSNSQVSVCPNFVSSFKEASWAALWRMRRGWSLRLSELCWSELQIGASPRMQKSSVSIAEWRHNCGWNVKTAARDKKEAATGCGESSASCELLSTNEANKLKFIKPEKRQFESIGIESLESIPLSVHQFKHCLSFFFLKLENCERIPAIYHLCAKCLRSLNASVFSPSREKSFTWRTAATACLDYLTFWAEPWWSINRLITWECIAVWHFGTVVLFRKNISAFTVLTQKYPVWNWFVLSGMLQHNYHGRFNVGYYINS